MLYLRKGRLWTYPQILDLAQKANVCDKPSKKLLSITNALAYITMEFIKNKLWTQSQILDLAKIVCQS
jgi:hypothetical protein